MAGLNLTPRHLDLLRAIGDGLVYRSDSGVDYRTTGQHRAWVGKSHLAELANAVPPLIETGPGEDLQRSWALTDAGREVLAAKEA